MSEEIKIEHRNQWVRKQKDATKKVPAGAGENRKCLRHLVYFLVS